MLSFLAAESPEALSLVVDEVLRVASSLRRWPRRGRCVPEFGEAEVRELFVFSYRLVYRVRTHEVEILTIVHGARNLGRLDSAGPDRVRETAGASRTASRYSSSSPRSFAVATGASHA